VAQTEDNVVTSLVLTNYPPHRRFSGAALRNWQNIRALGSFGPVDVVTVGVDDPPEPVAGIREWFPVSFRSRSAWDEFKTLCAPVRPYTHPGIDAYHCERAVKWLRGRGSRDGYDLAVIETVFLAAYLKDLRGCADRVVFDAHNVESMLQAEPLFDDLDETQSLLTRTKQRVLRHRMMVAEKHVITRADLVWACSEADARHIECLYGRGAGVTVVPNGVDVEAYRRSPSSPALDWSTGPLTMLYPGLLSYLPNEDAALRLIKHVLPAVRGRGYQARVVLVGRDPGSLLLDAAKQVPDVEVTGAVENVVPYLHQPCVVTLPIATGGGTRLKILEAFAAGAPVVSSAKGAEGIAVEDGRHLLLREEPDAVAEAVIQIWRRPDLRRHLCENALELVRRHYSWPAVTQVIGRSLEGACSDGSVGRPRDVAQAAPEAWPNRVR
jgi:polysaccharide biosynthesis protein PslH